MYVSISTEELESKRRHSIQFIHGLEIQDILKLPASSVHPKKFYKTMWSNCRALFSFFINLILTFYFRHDLPIDFLKFVKEQNCLILNFLMTSSEIRVKCSNRLKKQIRQLLMISDYPNLKHVSAFKRAEEPNKPKFRLEFWWYPSTQKIYQPDKKL